MEESNIIKNNIPFYLENIFDIAIFIQNLFWSDGEVEIPDIVNFKDIDYINEQLRKLAKHNDEQRKEYNEKVLKIGTQEKTKPSSLKQTDNIKGSIDIIQQLDKIANLYNSKYQSGYNSFGTTLLQK
jgi:hypothetical protein